MDKSAVLQLLSTWNLAVTENIQQEIICYIGKCINGLLIYMNMPLKRSEYDKFGSFYFLKLAGILFFFFVRLMSL